MILKIKKLNQNAIVPSYAKEGDSGLDLYTLHDTIIQPNSTTVISTGIAIELPFGHEATVRPRSGISLNGCKGCLRITMPTLEPISATPYLRVQFGTVDYGYRNDVGIITYNQEDYPVVVPAGTKLAQLVIAPVAYVHTELVTELSDTVRGLNGFGSTGC